MGKYNPLSLFSIIMNFIVKHAHALDSLVGFPSEIGEKIFKRTVDIDFFSSSAGAILDRKKIINLFAEAYGDLVLPALNLTNSLLVINEYTEEFLILFENISELDLSFCNLGSNHDIIMNMCHFAHLKKLFLKENCLDDSAIRKITLPVAQFQKGPVYLEELHLGGNPDLTDNIVPWITRLKHLKVLQLTRTGITGKGFYKLQTACGMVLCENNQLPVTTITTRGWAKSVIESLMRIIKSEHDLKMAVMSSAYSFQRLTRLEYKTAERSIPTSSENEIVFIRNVLEQSQPKESCSTPPPKRPCDIEDIQRNIFALYK